MKQVHDVIFAPYPIKERDTVLPSYTTWADNQEPTAIFALFLKYEFI